MIEWVKDFARRISGTAYSEVTQASFFRFGFLLVVVWAQPFGRVVDNSGSENSINL